MKLKNTIIWITNTIVCIVIILSLMIFYHMGDKPKIDKTRFVEKDVNELINTLLETDSNLEHVSVVLDETRPMELDPNINSPDSPIYAPPVDGTWFSQKDFDRLIQKSVINSKEAEYMFSLIDSSRVYTLDSTFIHKSVFSKKEYIETFTKNRKEAYNIIRRKYGTSCFVKFGTPLFNENSTKAIITVDKYCGYLNGLGRLLILEKITNRWQIIYEEETWVS